MGAEHRSKLRRADKTRTDAKRSVSCCIVFDGDSTDFRPLRCQELADRFASVPDRGAPTPNTAFDPIGRDRIIVDAAEPSGSADVRGSRGRWTARRSPRRGAVPTATQDVGRRELCLAQPARGQAYRDRFNWPPTVRTALKPLSNRVQVSWSPPTDRSTRLRNRSLRVRRAERRNSRSSDRRSWFDI